MSATVPLPLDVRLMNVTTSLLVTGLVLACVAAGLWWALRNPAFAIDRITVGGDTSHNSAASLRATVAPKLSGNFFTLDLAPRRRPSSGRPGCARPWCGASFPTA